MDYTNENLAHLIIQLDPSATWVYNQHCEFCGKFLYQDEIASTRCKKCRTHIRTPIARPIPFLTSATAIERLIVWTKSYNPDWTNRIIKIITDWSESPRDPDSYKLQIVAELVGATQQQIRSASHDQTQRSP